MTSVKDLIEYLEKNFDSDSDVTLLGGPVDLTLIQQTPRRKIELAPHLSTTIECPDCGINFELAEGCCD